ncbi:MAG: hypothetical protein IIX23_03330 [Oscillospiraceae bacterium]|nr:hypothetical protein [Oscillospiraceae bacterium]
MKKWISLACAIALLIALLPGVTLPATAAEASGKCGDNLTWEVHNGTLTISGTGPMYNYPDLKTAPWYELHNSIWHLDIQEGVTTIGDYAFSYLSLVTTRFSIPTSIEAIGSKAFSLVAGNLCFFGEAPEFAEDALEEYRGKNIYTLLPWAQEDKQSYGGSAKYLRMDLELSVNQCQCLIPVNTPLKAEHLVFQIDYGSQGRDSYIPNQVTFGEYDNSTCGEKKVTITADGYSFDFTYYVTDGSNHLDLINVEFPDVPTYMGDSSSYHIKPVVTIGTQVAKVNTHYTMQYGTRPEVGFGTVTIKGMGIWKDFSKTFYFPILKGDMSKHTYYPHDLYFAGMPIAPDGGFNYLEKGTHFEYILENNVNAGQASGWAVGLDNLYGYQEATFKIELDNQRVELSGEYIGKADGELSTDIPVYQQIIAPGNMTATIDLGNTHVVSYALYHLNGDKFDLILETTKDNINGPSHLIYDFSKIYEKSVDKGGEVYVLSYSWVRTDMSVYAGMTYLIIPAKVPDATSMTMYQVENDGDFRNEYFSVYGDDGALGDITWTSSDPSVASVGDGIVALNKPGTATITAQWGNLTQSQTISVDLLDLTEGIIFDYHEETGARVIWDSRLLEEGTDYTMSVEKNGKTVTVTVTGCGLFTGELMKEFVNLDSLADPHTHGFTNSCDNTCNGCDFTRDRDHTFSTEWSKDLENHYHECAVCGEQKDVAEHTLTGNGKECTVCGRLWTPGDIDGNGLVNRDDVIALLLHVSMPAAFPISIPADYTGDDQITRDDVIQLLLHISMPDAFPLQ